MANVLPATKKAPPPKVRRRACVGAGCRLSAVVGWVLVAGVRRRRRGLPTNLGRARRGFNPFLAWRRRRGLPPRLIRLPPISHRGSSASFRAAAGCPARLVFERPARAGLRPCTILLAVCDSAPQTLPINIVALACAQSSPPRRCVSGPCPASAPIDAIVAAAWIGL
jgi:hypothetical protein